MTSYQSTKYDYVAILSGHVMKKTYVKSEKKEHVEVKGEEEHAERSKGQKGKATGKGKSKKGKEGNKGKEGKAKSSQPYYKHQSWKTKEEYDPGQSKPWNKWHFNKKKANWQYKDEGKSGSV